MKDAALTIVVPVYNRAALVSRCLDSVYAQSLRPLRLIVVDNGSTDGTSTALTHWRHAHESASLSVQVITEMSPGASAARAAGLRRVRTPYVYFFDSDDTMRPHAAAALVEAFERHPQADIVMAPVVYHPIKGRARLIVPRPGDRLVQHFNHCTLRTQAYAVRTELLRAVGGWNGNLRIWDDWELGLRLLLGAPRVVRLHRPLADIYQQSGSVTGDSYSDRAGLYEPVLRAASRWIEMSARPDTLRLRRLLAVRRMMLASHYAREGRADLALPLRERVLSESTSDPWLHALLRAAYHYRRLGLHGLDTLLSPLL